VNNISLSTTQFREISDCGNDYERRWPWPLSHKFRPGPRQLALLLMIAASLASATAVSQESPWRLRDALRLPQWVSLSGSHRLLFENLDNQFRANRDGGDQALLLQTLVRAGLDFDNFQVVAELQDSRIELADSGSPLGTSSVNPLELLQSYVEVPIDGLLAPDSTSSLKAGRFTMDIGTRRLVARNAYRNAINAFTGVEWLWRSPEYGQVRLFYTLPVERRVDGNIRDNDPLLDKERDEVKFWGINYMPTAMPWGDQGEFFLYGINEDDGSDLATANREFLTTGFAAQPSTALTTRLNR